jgi:tetratricopeptide (TPR) repeat protein
LSYYKDSNKLFEEAGDDKGLKNSYLNIGLMFDRLNLPDSSLTYLQKAADLSDELDDIMFKAQTYNYLGNQHRRMGNYEKAETVLIDALNYAKASDLRFEIARATKNLSTLYFDTDNL